MTDPLVIGLDFGTDSVRAVLVNATTGSTMASEVSQYKRWSERRYCQPEANQFRQHPLDHIEGLEQAIKGVIRQSQAEGSMVKGICIDTTGSSPLAVDKEGHPLALSEQFADNPNAMMILWKDHTAVKEAEEINQLAAAWDGPDYLKYVGGIYSSEWFWAKILHVIREDAKVKEAAYSWIEHCDYLTFLLSDVFDIELLRRSRCAAGHKALWHSEWGGLPAADFLRKLDPYLAELKPRLYSDTFTSDQLAGNLNQEWASKLGLSTECVISVGTFDAHAGAVGAEVEEHTLVRVMGTSTCDIIVTSASELGDKPVQGICGQVSGSVVPGLIGLEAGQSAFGDLLAWFVDMISWPLHRLEDAGITLSKEQLGAVREKLIGDLSKEAENTPCSLQAPLALDWINGRRTPDADQTLMAAITNLNLGTGAPHIFRALVEAICFGSRAIVERFESQGVEIKEVVGIGGVAKKSTFIMQTLADVLNRPIKIAVSEQAPALGAAMYAAVAAGIYPRVSEAADAMGSGFERTYLPQPEAAAHYHQFYQSYQKLATFVEDSSNQKVR